MKAIMENSIAIIRYVQNVLRYLIKLVRDKLNIFCFILRIYRLYVNL